MSNPLDDPEYLRWAASVREGLLPKLTSSAFVMSIVPENGADVKFAVELGFALMLDKPIVLCITPGQHVPEKLVRVADDIVEADWRTEEGRSLGAARIQQVMKQMRERGLA